MPMNKRIDPDILHAALHGLEAKRATLQTHIEQLQSMLGQRRTAGRPASSTAPTQVKRKRVLSAEARKRISLAQRRRWAAARKAAKKG